MLVSMTIQKSEQLEDFHPEELLLGLSAPGLGVVVSAQVEIYSTEFAQKLMLLVISIGSFLSPPDP